MIVNSSAPNFTPRSNQVQTRLFKEATDKERVVAIRTAVRGHSKHVFDSFFISFAAASSRVVYDGGGSWMMRGSGR